MNSNKLVSNWYRINYELNQPIHQQGFTKEYDDKNRLEFENSYLRTLNGPNLIRDLDIFYYYNDQDSLIKTEAFNNLDISITPKVITNRYFSGNQLDSIYIINYSTSGLIKINIETFTYLEEYELKYEIYKQIYQDSLISIDSNRQIKSYPSDNILSEYSKIKEYWKDENEQFELILQTLFSETLSEDFLDFNHVQMINAGTVGNSTRQFFYKRKYPYEEPDSSYTSLETTLFPNPVKSNSRFAIENPEVFDYILVYNIVGQFIKKVNLVSDQDFVAPSLPGVYFILLMNDNNKVFFNTLKLVVIQ